MKYHDNFSQICRDDPVLYGDVFATTLGTHTGFHIPDVPHFRHSFEDTPLKKRHNRALSAAMTARKDYFYMPSELKLHTLKNAEEHALREKAEYAKKHS